MTLTQWNPSGGDTVGPAKYTPNLESIKPKRQTDFSRSRLKRELPGFSANSGKTPGPGHYEKPGAISENNALSIVGEDPYAYANSSAFASRVPMPHHVMLEEDQVRLNSLPCDVIGPPSGNIPSPAM